MAYATSNPPRLISQSVGASSGALWLYTDGDDIATVTGADYISDGDALGMAANDAIIVIDETKGLTYVGSVSSVTADGAASLALAPQTGGLVSGSGATVTLTAAQSGSTILLDRAAGIAFTLPAPVVGLKFTFIATIAVSSNAYSVTTDAGTTFLLGGVQQIIAASATSEGQVADGTSDTAMSMNGSTTGGLVGTQFTVECVSATQWQVSGILVSSGTLATPFS